MMFLWKNCIIKRKWMRCKNEGFRFLWIQKQVSLTLNLQGKVLRSLRCQV